MAWCEAARVEMGWWPAPAAANCCFDTCCWGWPGVMAAWPIMPWWIRGDRGGDVFMPASGPPLSVEPGS